MTNDVVPPKQPKKRPQESALDQRINELTEALQRERADSMNLRRRAEEEKLQMSGFYKAMVVRELLPALDNLDLALKHAPEDLQNHDYVKGVQSVVKQFEQILDKIGVQKIKTVGEAFDPNVHEAVATDESGQHERVVEELRSGYTINGELIRPAMVKVGK